MFGSKLRLEARGVGLEAQPRTPSPKPQVPSPMSQFVNRLILTLRIRPNPAIVATSDDPP
jgi:hypothetical protein